MGSLGDTATRCVANPLPHTLLPRHTLRLPPQNAGTN